MQIGELHPDLSPGKVASTPSLHRVQFYHDDQYLLLSVVEHLGEGVIAGGVGLGFVTDTHRDQIYNGLHAAGVPAEAIEKRCILVEASDGLARFMRRGYPDRQLFFSTLTELLGPHSSINGAVDSGVAAFGEMVAVLWAEGKHDAAIQLEQLWTEFANSHPISLLCAYPLSYFSRADDHQLFVQVCAHHSSVVPAESFVSGIVEEDQAREVAELQQRAGALASEIQARRNAEQHLRKSHAELEHAIQQRTEALRKLSLQVLRLQDIERRRIARELHESVGQDFAGLKMHLDLARKSPHDNKLWQRCDELLEHSIQEVRALSNLLHPPLIEDAGVAAAAEWYVRDFSKRTGITVEFAELHNLGLLSDASGLVVFRALQEILVNVYRHARASCAQVSSFRDEDFVTLTISDNGMGIPAERVERFNSSGTGMGVGLTGVSERVRELGGRCEIQSSASGTSVSIAVPAR